MCDLMKWSLHRPLHITALEFLLTQGVIFSNDDLIFLGAETAAPTPTNGPSASPPLIDTGIEIEANNKGDVLSTTEENASRTGKSVMEEQRSHASSISSNIQANIPSDKLFELVVNFEKESAKLRDLIVAEHEFYQFDINVTAASVVAFLRQKFGFKTVWSEELEYLTGYKFDDIKPCFNLLLDKFSITKELLCQKEGRAISQEHVEVLSFYDKLVAAAKEGSQTPIAILYELATKQNAAEKTRVAFNCYEFLRNHFNHQKYLVYCESQQRKNASMGDAMTMLHQSTIAASNQANATALNAQTQQMASQIGGGGAVPAQHPFNNPSVAATSKPQNGQQQQHPALAANPQLKLGNNNPMMQIHQMQTPQMPFPSLQGPQSLQHVLSARNNFAQGGVGNNNPGSGANFHPQILNSNMNNGNIMVPNNQQQQMQQMNQTFGGNRGVGGQGNPFFNSFMNLSQNMQVGPMGNPFAMGAKGNMNIPGQGNNMFGKANTAANLNGQNNNANNMFMRNFNTFGNIAGPKNFMAC